MWAVQRTDLDPVKYIKINHEGEENAWGETLQEILPFDLSSDPLADDDDSTPEDVAFIQPAPQQRH